MAQPTRRHKVIKPSKSEIKGSGEGLKYCNDCPFFSVDDVDNYRTYTCVPNDYVIDKGSRDEIKSIKVPKWCGNKKRNAIERFFNIK